MYVIIKYKIFRIIKIGWRGQRGQCPLVGEECGVTHQL